MLDNRVDFELGVDLGQDEVQLFLELDTPGVFARPGKKYVEELFAALWYIFETQHR